MGSNPKGPTLLDGSKRIFVCLGCSTHLASQDDIVSKAFQGRHGRAYLFKNVVNVVVGPSQERVLITGLHTVADVHCSVCQNTLGWKYLHAFEESQKYKEGCYIIEKTKTAKENNWEE